jgi:hypothetical protein
MIADPEIVTLILQGRVTQLRRPAPLRRKRHSFRVGRVHAIHRAHGEKAATSIIIREVRRQRLGAATIEDARREGYRTTAELFEQWEAKHGRLDVDAEVLVISFEKGYREQERYLRLTPPVYDPTAEDRPETDQDRGYTPNPSKGVPGRSVGDADLERFAKQAKSRDEERQHAELAELSHLPPAERLRRVVAESKRRGIDISAETRLIGQRIGRAEKRDNANANASES